MLRPIMPPEIEKVHKENISALIERESKRPQEHSKVFDRFSFLINKQVSCAFKLCLIVKM